MSPKEVYVKGNAQKIDISIVRSHRYEPILSKETLLEMNLIKILDSDEDSCVNVQTQNHCWKSMTMYLKALES